MAVLETKKKKKHMPKVSVRELMDEYQSNCERISEIADTCEKEKRERTEAESKEYEALCRSNQLLQMKMQAAAAEQLRDSSDSVAEANTIIRENLQNGRQTQIVLTRELMMVSDGSAGGIVPVKMQDVIDPLVEGLILDKVGHT